MSEQTEEPVQAAETVQEEVQEEAAGVDLGVQPNMEAIMHIPLEISVELGRVKMPLHELVRLSRGSVVQLHKEANASVEILANGAVFAQGEVVKADGKLGVRVTEVVSPTERALALA